MRHTLLIGSMLALPQVATAIDNGLGLTPPMGYNAYDHVGCCATEETMKAAGQALLDTGLHELGYEYVNADCGWIGGRHANGTLYENPTKFPSGMPALADWLHSRGLKLGLYSDRGPNDFSGKGLGMKGHESEDAATLARWNVDYLKVDDMSGSPRTEAGAYADYARIRDALNATGRHIFFSTCGHSGGTGAGNGNPSWMGPKCGELGNACRIAADVRFWGDGTFGTNKAVNNMASYGGLSSGPGAWPDPDLLYSYKPVGPENSTTCDFWCTGSFCDPVVSHSVAQFRLWAIMGAPLLLSFDVTKMDTFQLNLYSNPEIIAVNQDKDPATGRGTPGGRRVGGGDLVGPNSTAGTLVNRTNVWARNLHNGSTALLFLNNQDVGAGNATVVCDAACCERAKLELGKEYLVRDIGERKDRAPVKIGPEGVSSGVVAGDAGTVMWLLTPQQ